MIALIDSSVLVRKFFGEPNPLVQWHQITEAYASRLLIVEIARVIDRCRLMGQIDDDDVVMLHTEMQRVQSSIEILDVSERIWRRAAAPMPTHLGSLDAIHLAIAMELRDSREQPIIVATHDQQLAKAARSSGFEVVG